MLGAVGFGGLLIAFYGFSFGATRLLLRRTAWRQFSLEAPWLTGPAFLILIVSVLGYREPFAFPAWQAWSLLAGGFALSALVAVWDRVELAELIRQNGLRALLIALPAGLAAGLIMCFYPGNEWDNVFIPWVNEYINYAEMAAVLTGHHHGEPGTPVFEFCRWHRSLRYGQDIVVAAVAQVTGVHPMQAIMPLAVFFRFQQAIAIGLLVFSMARSKEQWKGALLLLVVDALLLIEVLIFASSFFSSNCTAPLFMIYLVWLACQQQFSFREWAIILLMNLFFFLTYPEFLVVAKCFEAVAILVALWRGNRLTWLPLAACNAAVIAMHPLQLWTKIQILKPHLTQVAGWNIIGDPILTPAHTINTLLGLRYDHRSYYPLGNHQEVARAVIFFVVALIAVGMVVLARRFRVGWMLLTWVGVLVVVHARSAINGTNYYPAFKLLSHTYFVFVLAAAALLFTHSAWWRRAAIGVLTLWLIVAGYCTQKFVTFLRHDGYSVSYSALRDTLRREADGKSLAVVCFHREPFFLANLVAGQTDMTLATLTAKQQQDISDRHLGRNMDCTSSTKDGTCFDGLVLCDPELVKDGLRSMGEDLFGLDCRRVVCKVGRLVLCEGRIYRPSTAEFPPFHWVFDGSNRTPPLIATSSKLRLTGEVSEHHALPYRCSCHLPEFNWSQDLVINKAGSFEVVLNLPEAAVGRFIGLEFKNYDTFRPSDTFRGSCDTRLLGFDLRALRFQ